MNSIWLLVGITAIAGVGGTGLGAVVACLFRKDSDKTVSLLLSFAAGVMTAVVCFDLLTEALNTDRSASNVWLVVLGVITGFAVIALLNAWIDKTTNHEVAHIDENHPQTADSLEELTHGRRLCHNGGPDSDQPWRADYGPDHRPAQYPGGHGCGGTADFWRHEQMEICRDDGIIRSAHHPGGVDGIPDRRHQPDCACHLPELRIRRHAVCGFRRTASGIHSDVEIQAACGTGGFGDADGFGYHLSLNIKQAGCRESSAASLLTVMGDGSVM